MWTALCLLAFAVCMLAWVVSLIISRLDQITGILKKMDARDEKRPWRDA